MDDGSYELTDHLVQRTGAEPIDAIDEAVRFLGRRGVRGRAAFLAMPDSSGCLLTAHVPPEDADVTAFELTRELFDHTPFEPGEAQLRYREFESEGRQRSCVVAALPVGHLDTFVNRLTEHDFGLLGLGFAGSATVRGARAMGLLTDETYLVEVLPKRTHLYAINGDEVHRYPLPFGEDDIANALGGDAGAARNAFVGKGQPADQTLLDRLATAAGPLAEDLKTTIEYHREQHRRDTLAEYGTPRVVPVGSRATTPTMRRVLHAVLGSFFDDSGAPAQPTLRTAEGGALAPSLAGALGAALEAFDGEEKRLALRPPPDEIPEYKDGPSLGALAAGALICGAIAAFFLWGPGSGASDPDTQPDDPRAGTQGADEAWAADPALAGQLEALAARVALMRAVRGCEQVLTEFRRPLVARHLWIEWTAGQVAGATPVWSGVLRLVATDGAELTSEDVQGLAPLLGDDLSVTTVHVENGVGEVSFRAAPEPFALESAEAGLPAREILDAAAALLGLPGDERGERLTDALRASSGGEVLETDPAFEVKVAGGTVFDLLEQAVASAGARTLTGLGATARSADEALVTVHASAVRRRRVPSQRIGEGTLRQVKAWLEFLQPGSPGGRFAKLGPTGALDAAGPALSLRAVSSAEGVRALFLKGPAGRVLERRSPGTAIWTPVPVAIPPGEGSVIDDWLPGPSGRYSWRLRAPGADGGTSDTVTLAVEVPATVTIAADSRTPAEAVRSGTCRFTVTRRFGGEDVRLDSGPLSAGTPVTAPAKLPGGTSVVVTTLYVFEGYDVRESSEPSLETVPHFRPDGTVERTADGAPVTVERRIPRPVTAVFVLLRLPSGEVRELRLEK